MKKYLIILLALVLISCTTDKYKPSTVADTKETRRAVKANSDEIQIQHSELENHHTALVQAQAAINTVKANQALVLEGMVRVDPALATVLVPRRHTLAAPTMPAVKVDYRHAAPLPPVFTQPGLAPPPAAISIVEGLLGASGLGGVGLLVLREYMNRKKHAVVTAEVDEYKAKYEEASRES